MDRSTFGLVVLLAAVLLAVAVAEEKYSDAFDHLNPDEILANDELRDQYYNCLMETGPCVDEGQKFFKEHAAEAFVTKCRKCTDKQKESFDKVVTWYTKNRPDEWTTLVKKLLDEAKKNNISPVI